MTISQSQLNGNLSTQQRGWIRAWVTAKVSLYNKRLGIPLTGAQKAWVEEWFVTQIEATKHDDLYTISKDDISKVMNRGRCSVWNWVNNPNKLPYLRKPPLGGTTNMRHYMLSDVLICLNDRRPCKLTTVETEAFKKLDEDYRNGH